ncbi:glycosyltransferase family 2 protein [bacterium]|nr:glycosyltransferase family 2 protein [candidate division CSSED10-310 bacterium]
MRANHKISVVIPCYNEEAGIAKVIPTLPEFVDEIVVVDNNSTDSTARVAQSLGARVVRETRQGYGAAYKCGLRAAEGDVIITMDGDGTYPAHAISYLFDIMIIEDLEFISAARIPIHFAHSLNMIQRYVGNIVLTFVTWLLFGIRLRDSQSGMWVFRSRILDDVRVLSDGMPFSEELKIRAFKNLKDRAREVPVQFKYVLRIGPSKLNLWGDGLKNMLYLFKLRLKL